MKIELILLLYDAFIGGEAVSRRDFCAAHAISERTFYRYIREVSVFLRAHKPDRVVDVAEPEGKYYLKKI